MLFWRTAFNGCFRRTTNIDRHYFAVEWCPTPEESVTTSQNISLEKMYLGNVLLKTNLFELTSRTQACRSAKIIYLNVMSSLTWSISKISLWVYPSLKYHCKRLSRSSIIQIDKKIKFSAQHVLLNILQQTWKRLIQQTIKSYTIYNIWNKIHQTFRKKYTKP